MVQPEALAVGQRDSQVRKLRCLANRGNRANRLLLAAKLTTAAGRFLLNLAQCTGDIRRRDAEGRHARRIELNPNLTFDSAKPLEPTDSGKRENSLGNGVIHKPRKLLLIKPGRRYGVGQNGRTYARGSTDGRLQKIIRQIRPDAVNRVLGFDQRVRQVLLQHEFDLD
ncbi:hypothetical protein Y59_29330 [Enterobacter hormaechei]|nr:hypothetical protein Y59_29330 [Enterobacter hormaechei]